MIARSRMPAGKSPRGQDCEDACLLAQAVGGLSIGLVLVDTHGRVVWLNRAAEHVLGTPRTQCVGRAIGQVLKDPQLAAFWRDAGEIEGHHMADIALRWPKRADLKANASRCYSPDGVLIGRAMLFCDVTDDRAVQVKLSQAVAHRLIGMAGGAADDGPPAGLTGQELRVLRLVGRGLSNDVIASEIGVSSSTVRSHLKSVYRKLALCSRAAAVSYAVRNNL